MGNKQHASPVYGGESNSAPSGGMDLAQFFRIVIRRGGTVVLMTGLGILAAVLFLQLAPSVYKARAELEMSVRRPRIIENEAVFEDSGAGRDTDTIFFTRLKKFQSPAMEELASAEYINRHGQQMKQTIVDGLELGRYTLIEYIKEVEWSKDPNANIVRISFESTNPRFAAELVNVMAFCAGELMMRENQALSDEAVRWLVSKVEEQRVSLEEEEQLLASMREDLQLDSLQQRKAALGQSLVSVSQEKEALISRLETRETVYEFVSGLKDTDPNLEILPTGLPKEEQLNDLIRVWRNANDELLLASDRYTELHPEHRKAVEKEARTRTRLEQFIELSSKAVENEIELLEKQIEQMSGRIQVMKSEAISLEQQLASGLQQLQRLERKRNAADNAYQNMLRRMEEARLSADEGMAFTKVIENAERPRIPVRPSKARVLILGFFLGGLAGCVLALLMEFWLDKISSVSDLKLLGLNILGTIPSQKKVASRGELATIGLRDKFDHLVEVFSEINALLGAERYAAQSRMLLVCSVFPGEGKTVSACNMAISSALNGMRTLLIDGDLRRPQLVHVFNIDEAHPSLLEWLSNGQGRLSHSSLISKDIIPNLDVITSRPLTEINPAELLGRGQLAELLAWARGRYDRIIIDSPPLGPVGDALVLANQADSLIVVSRIGKTRRRALRFALSRFREIEAPVLGCIANDVPHSLAGLFGGGEGYGYGYTGSYKSHGQDSG